MKQPASSALSQDPQAEVLELERPQRPAFDERDRVIDALHQAIGDPMGAEVENRGFPARDRAHKGSQVRVLQDAGLVEPLVQPRFSLAWTDEAIRPPPEVLFELRALRQVGTEHEGLLQLGALGLGQGRRMFQQGPAHVCEHVRGVVDASERPATRLQRLVEVAPDVEPVDDDHGVGHERQGHVDEAIPQIGGEDLDVGQARLSFLSEILRQIGLSPLLEDIDDTGFLEIDQDTDRRLVPLAERKLIDP